MIKKCITLKDIAREVGCSTSVVSTVLNRARGNTLVGEEMRRRVEETALRLNYHPNFAGRSMKSNRSHTLGIYVQNALWRQLSNVYEMNIFRGIEQAAREKQYDLLLINMSSGVLPTACAAKMSEHRIDGVVLIHSDIGAAWINDLLGLTTNVVAIDYNDRKEGLDTMMFDNAGAVRLAVEHLVQLGHRRIGFIASCLAQPQFDVVTRMKAFGEMVKVFGLNADERLIFNAEKCPRPILPEEQYCQLEGSFGAEYFNNMGTERPTAIIGYNDLVTLEALRQMLALNVKVPEEVSIISIDDSERCLYMCPKLTAVGHPMEQMGYEGALRLIDKIERGLTDHIHRLFTPEMLIRESTATVKRNNGK